VSVEGTYVLDVPRSIKAMTASLGDGGAGIVPMMTSALSTMDMTMEIRAGGAARYTLRENGGQPKTIDGTWKYLDDNDILLIADRGKGTRCTPQANTLVCTDAEKTEQSVPVVFVIQ
jgi:hypothetical protein